ncbi:nitrate- and nitrite sensing domain-containing protein [Pseudofrankia asymbiotica]|uniref:histidine kinase n=1 Tax=Pseudofrankia asymbiotica TaxID=1834516 RepID=A0A1V2I4S1_9ACTN|nr:nitrate- and nitrite sensing domain-containing protein [Pseudofrankia asymbiotica]ONH25659.1 hypothetical protein BL253_27015 [Pseudofrankia asymbiotica]
MENWPVRYRLAVALVVPLLALAGLATLLVTGQAGAAHAASRSQAAAQLTIKVNALVRALSQERYASSSYIGSGYRALAAETAASRAPVDRAYTEVRTVADSLPDDARLVAAVDAAKTQTDKLPGLRRQIDAHELKPGTGTDVFNGIVRAWLGVTPAQAGVGTTDPEVVRTVAALTAISNVAEQSAQQRGYVSILLILRRLDPDNFGLIRAASGAESAWVSQFDVYADQGQRQLYDQAVGPTLGPVTSLQDRALRAAQTNGTFDVTGVDWLAAANAKIEQLRNVEAQITLDLANRSSTLASSARTRAWLAGLLAGIVMVLTVAVSVVIARRLARQLRALREDALDMAEQRLPAVTAAIRDRRPVDADIGADNMARGPADEIGDVARSLREVYAAAVQSATEVAAQHSLSASMRNLARRSQTLIHRQLKLITDLERDQQDPDMLDRLFRLDHLATRMRREVEGQIALSGGRPSRVFRSPVKLVDAMRAAVAEVEAYTRVEVSSAIDIRIVGPVVGDVIHLLAELVENATQMSPENTMVTVSGSPVGTGVAVEISDRGIGIVNETMTELNARLADPPPFNPEQQGDKLGLWVVANLAARHGIEVQLTRSAYGGVTAVVLLPSEVLVDDSAAVPPVVDDPLRAALDRISALERLDAVGVGYDNPFAVGNGGHAATGNGAGEDSLADDGAYLDGLDVDYDADPSQVLTVRESFFRPLPRRPGVESTSDGQNGAGADGANGAGRPGSDEAGSEEVAPAAAGATGPTLFDAVRADWGNTLELPPITVGSPSGPTQRPPAGPTGPAAPTGPGAPAGPPAPTGPLTLAGPTATGPAAPAGPAGPKSPAAEAGPAGARPAAPRPASSPRPAAQRPAAPFAPRPQVPTAPGGTSGPGGSSALTGATTLAGAAGLVEPPLGHLPHRRRGEHLSAELRGGRRVAAAATPAAKGAGPDPEKARNLVTSFRAGFRQGLPGDDERMGDASHR